MGVCMCVCVCGCMWLKVGECVRTADGMSLMACVAGMGRVHIMIIFIFAGWFPHSR